MILKTMEKLIDRLTVDNGPLNKEQNEPKIRNPNFRRPNPPPPPQIRQRDMRNPRNPYDQQIRPPFPENYVADVEEVGPIEDQIHHFGDLDFEIHLIEEEHSMFSQEDANNDFEEESEQYQRGYLHAIDDVQRNIKLRNRDVIVNKGRFNKNQPSSSQQNIEKRSEKQKEPIVYKESKNKIEKTKEVKQPALVDVEKVVSTFNFNQISQN